MTLLLLLLAGCSTMPRLPPPQPNFAPPPATTGVLTRLAQAVQGSEPGSSTFRLLHNNEDAFKARLALVDLAQHTLDLQYFIWENDATGRLLLQHVIAAADRGVRVRLLLDDLALGGLDPELAALDSHPNIEVRIFNPWTARSWALRPLEFVVQMGRLNHRMHNKLFIADGHFAIVGGRNIGDRYFGVYKKFVQNDLDVMACGPITSAVENSFDEYWNSIATAPVYWPEKPGQGMAWLRHRLERGLRRKQQRLVSFAVPPAGWGGYLAQLLKASSHGTAQVYVDSPDVTSDTGWQVYADLRVFMRRAQHEVLVSSPYLVPDKVFLREMHGLTTRGVKVRILTNSLASNSHVIAHAAYQKHRRALLHAGVELYEMRPKPKILPYFSTPPVEAKRLALHAKAIVVDQRWVFVGSPNLDPRSLRINTEVGLAIDDPTLARQVAGILERDMRPENAWHVTVDEEGWLHWHRGQRTLNRQPASGFLQRMQEFFMNLIPIKNQT